MTSSLQNLPNWLHGQLFEDILQKSLPNFESLKSFKAQAANGIGENYATQVVRLYFEVQLKGKRNINYI